MKEELLEYIRTEINEDNFLILHEVIISSGEEGSILVNGINVDRTLKIRYSRLENLINDRFDDDLVGGYTDQDPTIVKILSWDKIEREPFFRDE